jgi:hypothetical protein
MTRRKDTAEVVRVLAQIAAGALLFLFLVKAVTWLITGEVPQW